MGVRQMTREQKQMARRLKAKGLTLKEIARDLSCSLALVTASVYVQREGVGVPDRWKPAPGHLSAEEREEILLGLGRKESMSAIARSLGRAPSTIAREVAANGGAVRYGAWRAHCRAEASSRRPKPAKLAHPPLARQVTTWLERLWSPQEISARLRLEFEGDPMMQVSHETIYQSLFVQGRGELRRELARCLRSGRTARRHQGRVEKRGKIPNMVMISARPTEVEDRAVPGHWEGDLIIGAGNKSAVGTLVERSTRFVLLLHLPDGYAAVNVERAMRKAILKLPDELARSITWDQGHEMAGHVDFTVATGIPIYFCDPHSPWQRGSNENTNGLLRQFMPKSTDLSQHSAADLARFQRSLNGRPRKTLGYMKPSEKFAELVALTA
jgi:IS30 family transposase